MQSTRRKEKYRRTERMGTIMADMKFEIVDQLLVISESTSSWKLELNIVKWYDNEPKYDLRNWNSDHSKCGKGITLTEDELNALLKFKK